MNETAFDHIAGNDYCTVTAAEKWSKNLVLKLKEKYPDDVQIIHTNKDGSIVAHVPFKWMKLTPKRANNLTQEQRRAMAERMRAYHEYKDEGEEAYKEHLDIYG